MRIVFIGCVRFSRTLLIRVLSQPGVEVVGIVSKTQSDFNADFCSLAPIAREEGIPALLVSGEHTQALREFVENLRPDVCFCFGWPHLLKQEILSIPRLGVVGYHPTALPMNRGRHPIIWTLVLGLAQTASTFFMMDEGADSGDILSQEPVAVLQDDDAQSLYSKLESTAGQQIDNLVAAMVAGKFQRVPQDNARGNIWRRRYARDGQIDWRMAASTICNLVRALTRPYPGAHFVHNGIEFKIWRVELLKQPDSALANVEPGRVIMKDGDSFGIRCGIDAIRIVEMEPKLENLQVGDYL